MIANMDAWARSNTPPPESRYPHISDGTLVPLGKYAFPSIPGVKQPHEANAAYRLDYGPNWRGGILGLQPPRVRQSFTVLVPQVDADGNETSGIRLPEITVPLATYASWNLRDPSIGASEQRVSFEGSYLPFAKTAEDRRGKRDPRKAIAERYSGRQDYLTRYSRAVDALANARWILKEDVPSLLSRGEQEWDEAMR